MGEISTRKKEHYFLQIGKANAFFDKNLKKSEKNITTLLQKIKPRFCQI